MEAEGCYEAMVNVRVTTEYHKPEDCDLKFDGNENVTSQI